MIDVSDGLTQDLDHIATQSGIGARLDAVPVAEGASLEDGLGGARTTSSSSRRHLTPRCSRCLLQRSLPAPVRIGVFTPDADERTLAGRPLEIRGWEHPFK